MTIRKIAAALAAIALLLPAVRADEGMWLPMLISQRIEHMHEKGFTLGAEDISSINQASLKGRRGAVRRRLHGRGRLA